MRLEFYIFNFAAAPKGVPTCLDSSQLMFITHAKRHFAKNEIITSLKSMGKCGSIHVGLSPGGLSELSLIRA